MGPGTRPTLLSTVLLHLVAGLEEDPCASHISNVHRFWPRDQTRPQHPSTYAPPADLASRSFVILAAPRSASNSLVNVLNRKIVNGSYTQNPYVEANPEVFHPESMSGKFAHAGWTPAARDANRSEFMRRIFELDEFPGVPGARARGLKVFNSHLSEDELRLITRQKHVLKIVLRRQDTLGQYVSALRAGELGFWRAPGRLSSGLVLEEDEPVKVPICVEKYEEWLAAHNSWYEWCERESLTHPESWHFVSTERLTSDPSALLTIYSLLSVPVGEMLEYTPYASDNLETKVSNYADIAHLLCDVDNLW